MKHKIFLVFCLAFALAAKGQSIYGVLSLTAPFNGLSSAPNHNSKEFKASLIRINVSWKAEVIIERKKISHKLSIEQQPIGYSFKISDKFSAPPNNSQLLSFNYSRYAESIDNFFLSYALQKGGRNFKGFILKSKIKLNSSAGIGISFNRSKSFYETQFLNSSGGISTPDTYLGYYADHFRDGIGLFLSGAAGFDICNKKGKKRLCFKVFYNQGLRSMMKFNVHYKYGYFTDPTRQVDVPLQILRIRGTNFGLSLGIPITIKKLIK